jgi:predicted transposase/invertase (TIGR01784 family)
MKITNPHDLFFKASFSEKKNAIALIKNLFPAPLRNNIRVDTLKLEKDSYVDEKLSQTFSDLVYSCSYKGESLIRISILFEHKSGLVHFPEIQITKYILSIWEHEIKQKKSPSPVIPVIFYQGKEKWTVSGKSDYFKGADEKLKEYIPLSKYVLIDLADYPNETIKRKKIPAGFRLVLFAMKNIRDEQLIKESIPELLGLLQDEKEAEAGRDFYLKFISYILNTTKLEIDYIIEEAGKISPQVRRKMMTTADKLRKEGKLAGIAEGIAKGKIEIAEKMFREGLPSDIIKKITGIVPSEISKKRSGEKVK